MNKSAGSPVVDAMKKRSLDTWRAWRAHVEAGTADTDEALALWDEATLASTVLMDEVAGRGELERARRNAAVDDRGPEADLGLAVAIEQARAA